MAHGAAGHDPLDLARRLVEAIEAGDAAATSQLLLGLNDDRYDALFGKVGRLTRELRDSLSQLAADDRLISLAHECMPDARERLRYVIAATEDAANRTLTAVEAMLPASDRLVRQAGALRDALAAGGDVAALTAQVRDFLDDVERDGRKLRSSLGEVLMAQEYQDLTGQAIKRTIELVGQVESKLVDMVSACGAAAAGDAWTTAVPAVPGRDEHAFGRRQPDVDELLASLGF